MTAPAPSSSFSEDLLVGLAELLADRLGWAWRPDGPAYAAGEVGIVLEELPAGPDELVALSSYDLDRAAAGVPYEVPVDLVGVQLRTRTAPGVHGARRLDDAAYDVLEGLELVTLAGVDVVNVWRNSAASMGRDPQGRRERVSNYYLLVQRPTQARPQA